MKKRIQKPEDERKILPRNEKSIELTEGRRRCPKCKSTNLLAVGGRRRFQSLLFRL